MFTYCVILHTTFRSPGKYPQPEQLPNPVMYSYQGRGRPRKHWTPGTVSFFQHPRIYLSININTGIYRCEY